ncbi:DHA2 family efflux MFS transporter permease subunit [Mycolicibacterium sp. 018/SC-01/001]|uniref:DHA2 family efflux MFS transporter permease subunit n=1 Tax=Mycolicibacterium sp. 018/SC-01/001 TaxID=2592069 RepID=UPI001180D8BB|nr:DHA2 family efflux MFS transporter permease subunit [Mycolicibacterium sp. 018/SC-01/001]TRW82085.1 DHA2 family efflux MFS transporter permease subunit [Mycolicibacterium sp. 018/SC-01/001]
MSETAVRPVTVLLITSAATFLLSLDLFIVNIAFPAIGAAFPGSDLADLSWILNSYTIVFAAVLGLAGRLADRHGHRRLFLIGLSVFTVASAACAAAPSVWLLVAARALQGVGAALVMPSSLSLLLAAWPPERRGVAVGTWASIGAVAAALGPPLGGLLVTASWEWVFLVNVPIGVLALVAGARVLRETDTSRAGRPDVLGAACLIVGVGALAYALVAAPENGWLALDVLVGAAVAVVGLAAVVVRSRRHPVPAVEMAVLRVPQMALAASMMLLFICGFAGMLIVNVAYLTQTWGWTAQAAGLALAPGPAVVVVVSRLAGQAMSRLSVGVLATAGSVCFAAGAGWWLLRLSLTPNYLGGMLPGQLLTGLGVGLVLPTLSSVVGSALPAEHWGSGSSLISTARQVGTVLGVALIVTVMGADGGGALPAGLPAIQAGWTLLAAAATSAAIIGVVFIVVERRLRAIAALPGSDLL